MEAVWIALVVFGFALIVFLVLLQVFPEEMRSLVSRTASIRVGTRGIAWDFFEEAVRVKENREPKRKEADPPMRKISGGRILWVDDSPANNRLEVQALRSLGVEVDTAMSNEEAVEYAAGRDYDLVLSDIERASPQRSQAGLQLPEQLGAWARAIPIAYYVGHATAPRTPAGQAVFDTPTELLNFVAEQLGGGAP